MERPLAASPSMIADRERQLVNASTIGGKSRPRGDALACYKSPEACEDALS
jgi:hypothetical protein